jgi:hypothetical protein
MNKESPWRRMISECAGRISKRYPGIDRAFARRMARRLVTLLVPRRTPGQKPTRAVLTAIRLRARGLPWNAIYPRAIIGFAEMPWHLQSIRKHNLRRAVYALRRRRNQQKLEG